MPTCALSGPVVTRARGAEERAIGLTSPPPFLACAVFGYVTARVGLHSVSSTVKLAVAVRLIGPLSLILTNAHL